ncbi:MAG: glycoside hydrolase, partial [Bacteroidaceae bacterium]|nr:glycoside hydrolase [Bacteroidaceae bacterium]
MKKKIWTFCVCMLISSVVLSQDFKLNTENYFENEGVNVMVFNDVYPEGHQGGLTLVMNSHRIAANGDIRFEATPGQWQPLPKLRKRLVSQKDNMIQVTLSYPDSLKHKAGFNPFIYPDFVFSYQIKVVGEGSHLHLTVDLDKPVPEKYKGKIGFNLELYPGDLLGKTWIMDNQSGIFPQQAIGPTVKKISVTNFIGNFNPQGKADEKYLLAEGYNPMRADNIIEAPFSKGKRFTLNPDDPYSKVTIESGQGNLILYDGRLNHPNGWFVLRTEIPVGVSKHAIDWIITPNVVNSWRYKPVVQTSQVGYHPHQPKVAVIELDSRDKNFLQPALYQITSQGDVLVYKSPVMTYGKFNRYHYLKFDFSSVTKEGLYQVRYGDSYSSVFKISSDIYDRGIWQTELEYFLPVQMCHMRVNEKYRVWHGLCHMDDARMAPVNFNHIDGYSQGPSTLTKYKSGDLVPGLNIGGWHDAGDYDLRIESQAGEAYLLALAYETFHKNYDETSIDQIKRVTE